MENAKRKIITLWLTRIFLRRIGKRYPDFFNHWIADITDNKYQRKVMKLRYTGDSPMKFEAIAIEMHTDISNVFKYHKRTIDRMIPDILP